MKRNKTMVTFALALCMLVPASLFASSHREAPISALDHSADVTDWYAFVSYDHPDRVTMILNVDGFLEPSNGPNYFPFDPNVLYEMKIDNNRDGVEDVTFQFRFKTEIRQPGVFTGFVGGIGGILQRDLEHVSLCGGVFDLLRDRIVLAGHLQSRLQGLVGRLLGLIHRSG